MHMRFLTIATGLLFLAMTSPAGAQGWVSFLHTPPEVQPEGVALVLEGSLIGVASTERIDVRYRRIGEADWGSVAIVPAHGDLYQAVIPAGEVTSPGIEYYLVLVDAGGEERPVFASPSSPRRVRVDPPGRPRDDAPVPTPPRPPEHTSPATPTAPPAAPPRIGPDEPRPDAAVGPDGADIVHPFFAEQTVVLAGSTQQTVTNAPAIITVVSSRQMQAMGARTLADVLKSVPGLETSRSVQGFHQVSVRGIRSDPEVLLLYDGRRLDSLYDGRKLYELPIENVERVEVLRGPGATLHGTGAFLAVINVVSKRIEGFRAAASADTHSLASLHLGFGRVLEEGRFQLEGDLDAGQGYRAPILTDAFDRSTRSPAGFTDDSRMLLQAGGTFLHELGDGELTLSMRGIHQDRGALVGAFDSVGTGSSLNWSLLLGKARYDLEIGAASVSLGLEGDQQWARRRFRLTPIDFRSVENHIFPDGVIEEISHTTRELAFDANARMSLFEGNVLSLGFIAGLQSMSDWRYAVNMDPGTGQPLDNPIPPADEQFPAHDPGLANRLTVAVFALNEWRIAESMELTLGFRGDLFSGGVGRDDPAAPVGTRGMEFALTPRLGLVWSPAESWTVKVLHSTAFRVPTFEELTSRLVQGTVSRGRYEGNPTLAPVRIRTTELGLEHGFFMASRDFRLRLNGFVNEFSDRIEAVDLTGNITPYNNRDGVIRVFGAEGEGRMVFSSRDWISGGMAWFRAIDSRAPEGRNLLTTMPQLRLIIRSQMGIGNWLDLHVGALFGAERRNNARSSLESLRRFSIPPYAIVDVTLQTRPIAERVSFALTANNLLDVPYQDDVPRPDRMEGLLPGPGISARLTARMQW